MTTLQKACTAQVFEANPANCPAASIIGHATATTPVLPVPLTGPAFFVSHGNESFPSLIIVLQGYGVTVHLVGSTFISKQGITSSTFKTVPDVPVGTFELTLPDRARTPRWPPTRTSARPTRDAHRIPRAERGADQDHHQDPAHRLPQGQEGDTQEENAHQTKGKQAKGKHANSKSGTAKKR